MIAPKFDDSITVLRLIWLRWAGLQDQRARDESGRRTRVQRGGTVLGGYVQLTTQKYYTRAKSLGSCVLDARLDLNSRKLERAGIRQRIDMCVQNA